MDDESKNWKKFQKLRFDRQGMGDRMRRAESATTSHARRFIFRRVNSIREARRQIMTWLVLVGVLIAAVAAQTFWFQRSYTTSVPTDGGTYAEGSLGPIETLNPLYAVSEAEQAASRLLFSSLFTYDTAGTLAPDLAVNYAVDKSKRVYTVNLRPDAKWHDGRAVTAEDIVFTIDLIKNPDVRSPLRINWQDVSVRAVGENKIEFTLPAVYAAFPQAMTFPILPKHILGAVAPATIRENRFSQNPVGSGPFAFRLLQSIDQNQKKRTVHLIANSDYYKGKPRLARFEVHSYPDQTTISRALQIGEINAASISPEQLDRLNQTRFEIATKPINNGVYALFNTKKSLLADQTVRRALQSGTDTEALRAKLAGKPSALSLPFFPTKNDNVKAPPYDQTQAARQLDKAGWKLRDGVRQKKKQALRFTITTTKDAQYEIAAKELAEQWRQIGADVSVSVIDTSNPSVNFIQDTLQPRNFDVLIYELIIGADPDVYAYWHSSQGGISGYNFTGYSNALADANLSSARSRVEADIREPKYRAFAKQWLRDAPAVGLYQPTIGYVTLPSMRSIEQDATLISPIDRFSNVLYWSVDEKSVYKTP